ncbi:mesoderm induction early response protein 2 isoform X2 [Heteronotia binoei]|uniref:mesoderm induction early response protein 2 isoform X2 n=1 Tax=Heteronotia binoei TaxID=13085 RepID=UPI0029309520|nr:mesoderm induction early response protein 2 isoform X2 [Heteronotia binoei]
MAEATISGAGIFPALHTNHQCFLLIPSWKGLRFLLDCVLSSWYPVDSLSKQASFGRESPRVVSYPACNLCPGRLNLHTTAVVPMGSADHRFNLAEILSQNYGVREEREEEEHTHGKAKPLEELEKSFNASQNSDMPFEELLALYGYEASDPVSEQDSESNDVTPNLPDMTLDKEQIAKDLLSGEEEEETQSSADDLTPSVTSHDASDLFPNQPGSNFLAEEDKGPSSSPCASFSAEDSEEDSIPPSDCKKEIMVGPQYQAAVPLLQWNRHGEKVYENDDQLLWDPNILPEREVEEFLYRAIKRRWDEVSNPSLPEGEVVKDNEQALYELVKCNFNAEEALRRLRFNVKVIRDELCAWSEEECRNFEHGFRVHGKNFHLIQANKVRTRSVGECVEYYYMWKKSERYDYFAQQTRFGRKKDYVDNFLDGAEVESGSRSRGSPHLPSATGSLDSRFNPDHLAMESTEPLSIESAACSLGSTSESGHGYECSTPSEINCSFDHPSEETPVGSGGTSAFLRQPPNPSEAGFYQLAAAAKQEPVRCAGEAIAVDFTLPENVSEGLPLISGRMGLDRGPETLAAPAQVSLSVPDFSILGVGDGNSFLASQQACPAPVTHAESFSQ